MLISLQSIKKTVQSLKKFIVCCGLMMLGGEISQATDEATFLISAAKAKTLDARKSYLNKAQNILRTATHPDALLLQGDAEGNTALIVAVCNDYPEMVQALLEAASDKDTLVQWQNAYGKTALICAAENNDLDMVRVLLDAASEKDTLLQIQDILNNTALMHAAFNNNLDIVRALLDAASDKDTLLQLSDDGKETALMRAVRAGNVDMVKYLLNSSLNRNKTSATQKIHDGNTALILAPYNNQFGTLKNISKISKATLDTDTLLQKQDIFRRTVLIWAVYNAVYPYNAVHIYNAVDIYNKVNNAIKIIQKILEAASDKDALIQKEDDTGKTALIRAVETNCLDIVRMLLDAITDAATRQRLIQESLKYTDNDEMKELLQSYSAAQP